MAAKKLLAVALMVAAGSSQALTLEQSRGMVYAQCAGVYMAEASVAYGQNRMEDYYLAERLLTAASTGASERIGDGRTTDIGEATVARLLNAYKKNPILGEDLIAKERLTCSKIFENNQ
jgi:predicted DNA-binding protein